MTDAYSKRPLTALLKGAALLALLATGLPAAEKVSEVPATGQWPQWRGPSGSGSAPLADPPTSWSEEKNIRWKVQIPGNGHSTPVVWDQRIFLTTAVPYGDAVVPKPETAPGAHDNVPVTHHHEFTVLAVSRKDGTVEWQKVVHRELPHARRHYTGSFASNSPVTDGRRIYAFFGSRGIYCLSLDGELKWQKDLGKMQIKHAHGEGSSPALYNDTLIVNWDHEGQSCVMAFDKHTGDERWRNARDEVTSWASPITFDFQGKPQAVISGTSSIRSYDLATGTVLWECGGLSHNIVATPIAAHGMVFAASSYEKQALLAIRLAGASGDITNTDQVVWTRNQRTPYVPSPLLYDDSLYFLRHYQGILSRIHATSGEERLGPFRLFGVRNIYSSPVAAASRIYITDLDGATVVVSHTDKPEVLAVNQLDDGFSASAALVGRDLILRGHRSLYCITNPK